MTKSKKHSPMQTETEPSIISQVPPEAMKDFIEGMVAMAQAKRAQESQSSEALSQEPVIVDPDFQSFLDNPAQQPQTESQASSPSGFRDLKMDPPPSVLSPLPRKNK